MIAGAILIGIGLYKGRLGQGLLNMAGYVSLMLHGLMTQDMNPTGEKPNHPHKPR